MSDDLFYLTLTAGLGVIMWIPPILALIMTHGLPKPADYRSAAEKTLPEWGQRARRAHLNLVENLAPFAALVLVAHVAGAANATTALWSAVFFWARVAHALVLYAGLPYLRTLVFVVGVAAQVAIFLEIL